MDCIVGPTFAIDVQSSPPYTGNRPTGNVFYAGDSSESESSIGSPDDSDDQNDTVSPKRNRVEDEDGEVQSNLKGLSSLDSLEDSLPIKKGLSNHFIGKSKSFTDLSQVSNVKDVKELQKQENPFNKRRRVLIASKWSRKSFYSWSNPKSMPLLPLDEDDDDDQEYEIEEANKEATIKESPSSSSSSSIDEKNKNPQEQVLMRQQNRVPQSYAAHMRLRLGSFKSRSFSLADLQEHDEVEGEDHDDDDEEENDEQHLC